MGFPLPIPEYRNCLPPAPLPPRPPKPTRREALINKINLWYRSHFHSTKKLIPLPKDQALFYKTNEFWGTTGIAVTFILAGVAFGVSGHIILAKWLLVAAWPFAALASWCAFVRLRRGYRVLFSVLTSLLLAGVLHKSYIMMHIEQPKPQIINLPAPQPWIGEGQPKTQPVPTPELLKPEPISPSVKVPSIQPPPIGMPNVSLRFLYPKAPALMFVNPSDFVARDIKSAVVLWNMDLPDRNDPLPIPSSSVDWIKPHDEVGPTNLFGAPIIAPLLNAGNRLFGSAMVDCATCSRGRTYIVYIVLGEGGWFSEINKNHPGKLLVPQNFSKETREAYFRLLDSLVPPSVRIPIGSLPLTTEPPVSQPKEAAVPQKPASASSVNVESINQQGGITAGIVNVNPGPKPLLLSDAQQESIRKAMAPFTGNKIWVIRNNPTEETQAFAIRFESALRLAGIIVEAERAAMYVPPSNCINHPGVWFIVGANRMNEAKSLAVVLGSSGVVEGQVPGCTTEKPDDFTIVIARP
jgi:hypothetical protein